jgi:hypothetical protein
MSILLGKGQSVNIFNSTFELNVNEGLGSFKQILNAMRNQAKGNKTINKVNKKLISFQKDKYYREIIKMRNLNTHSVRVTQFGFIDTYDSITGITTGTVNTPMKSNEIVFVILESIKLLGEYTDFIEENIRVYYDDLYDEYQKMDEEEI